MSLAAGEKLGPYEILGLIGAGGMGEVYRARDTRLKRDVALKVLPESVARDPGRMARFQREAELLASLNHPNIAHIYGVEERALVMELIEGESPRGPMLFEEAWKLALQSADALEYAHERGIIHRDLKPANMKVTPEGVLKLLDFGLAKALNEAPDSAPSDPSNSPTVTLGATVAGTIMGTAAYMAPEQAKGKRVDKRADIWSWGVVLYELLTGERLFAGDDAADTLAQVLTKQPDLERISPQARSLLRRCLEKDPKQRLRDIGEARYLLQSGPDIPPKTETRLPKLPWVLTAFFVAIAATVSLIHFRETPPQERTLRYRITAPENSSLHSFALSPDGRYLAIAATINGKRQLWVRPLDGFQLQSLPNTEDAQFPFWSPDSNHIGFFAQGKLKKIAANGGPAQTLCNVSEVSGGAWSPEDVILFASTSGAPVQRVPAAGGTPADVTKPLGRVRNLSFLPGGRYFLYTIGGARDAVVYLGSLDGKENRRVLADAQFAVFTPFTMQSHSGHVLFIREDTLMAQAFDADKAQVSGDVFPVAENVAIQARGPYTPVTVSGNGIMVYNRTEDTEAPSQLVWIDRGGKPIDSQGVLGSGPSISPDGKAFAYIRNPGGHSEIWVRDTASEREIRLTSDPSRNTTPFWSPNGERIVYRSERGGKAGDLYQRAANGAGQDELLVGTMNNKIPNQWSRDGRYIVYSEAGGAGSLWVLPVPVGGVPSAAQKPVPFLPEGTGQNHGQLSPDSRWMAYTSPEAGRQEVFVRPFPAASDFRWKISTAGGVQPRWRGDGKELYFVGLDGKMMAVPVKAGQTSTKDGPKPSLDVGTPVPLFETRIVGGASPRAFQYDVTADGTRFLIATSGEASAPILTVEVNGIAGLKK